MDLERMLSGNQENDLCLALRVDRKLDTALTVIVTTDLMRFSPSIGLR